MVSELEDSCYKLHFHCTESNLYYTVCVKIAISSLCKPVVSPILSTFYRNVDKLFGISPITDGHLADHFMGTICAIA